MDNGPLDGKGSNWLMGRLGLDLLIPVHCPLVTECHSTSLPNGCQGDQANTTPAGSPNPNPHPTKPFAANRKGKAGYCCLGRRKRKRQHQMIAFALHFSKEKSYVPHSSPGRHMGPGRCLPSQGAHCIPGREDTTLIS